MKYTFYSLIIFSVFSVAAWVNGVDAKSYTSSSYSNWIDEQVRTFSSEARNLNPDVLKLGLKAYVKAREAGLVEKQILTIIDYSKPSDESRMFILDLKNSKVLFNTLVSHGKNSGAKMATSFSNQNGTHKSVFGVMVTDQTYIGNNGYSLRLKGLEKGFNENAESRAIVIHGAWYVNRDVIQRYGQLGRSWGCPAVNPNIAKPLIDTIKNKTLVFAYAPDQNWLHKSSFLLG